MRIFKTLKKDLESVRPMATRTENGPGHGPECCCFRCTRVRYERAQDTADTHWQQVIFVLAVLIVGLWAWMTHEFAGRTPQGSENVPVVNGYETLKR